MDSICKSYSNPIVHCRTNIHSLIVKTGTVTTDWQGHAHLRWRLCLQQCEHNTLFDFSLNR